MRKTSAGARVKRSRIIAEQRRSGLSVAKFCDAQGVPACSLYKWKRKLAGVREGGTTTTAVFVEAKVGGVDDDHRGSVRVIAIEVVGGRRVLVGRGFDRQLLLEVIEALEPAGVRS